MKLAESAWTRKRLLTWIVCFFILLIDGTSLVQAEEKSIYVGWWDHGNGAGNFELYNEGEDTPMQWALPGENLIFKNISKGRHPKADRRIKNTEAEIAASGAARKVRLVLSKKEAGEADFTPVGLPFVLNTNEGFKVSQTWQLPANTQPTTVYKLERWLGDGADWYWSVLIYPRGVAIKTLEFKTDHNLMRDGTSLTTAGERFPDIEWNKSADSATNAPITHTVSETQKIGIELVVDVGGIEANSAYTLTGTSDETAYVFSKTGTISSGQAIAIPLTAENPITKDVRKIEKTITWKMEIAGKEYKLGNTGPHKCFTTLGTPNISAPQDASKPNVARMELAVTKVKAAQAASACDAGIVYELVKDSGNYLLGFTLGQAQAWKKPETEADCISIARYVQNICYVMGVAGSFDVNTYIAYYRTAADPDRPNEGIVGDLNNPIIRPGDRGNPSTAELDAQWGLALADSHTTNGGGVGGIKGLNAFEAAVVYTDNNGKKIYFPAGVTGNPVFDKGEHVVRIFKTMVWVSLAKIDHDNDPTTPPEFQVKKVEWTYTRPPSVNPCGATP